MKYPTLFIKAAAGLCMAGLALCFPAITRAAASIQYSTTSDWGQGFNGQITISNTGTQPLSGWTLEFDFDRSIDVIWNATVVSHSGNHYKIQSAGWNDVIAVNGSTAFGFGGSPGGVQQGPTNFQITGGGVTPPGPGGSGNVGVSITQLSQWEGGFTANLTIANQGSQPIAPWMLTFGFQPSIQSVWNGSFTAQGPIYQIFGVGPSASIAPGGAVTVGMMAAGTLAPSSVSGCQFNGAACSVNVVLASTGPPPSSAQIVISQVDSSSPATQVTVGQASTPYSLSVSGQGNPNFSVMSNNSSVATATVSGANLQVTGVAAGRASLKITEANSGAVRYIGVRVRNADGSLPGLPAYLSVGSVSEDTAGDLSFWQAFDSGSRNHRVDERYIYLNGGPVNGWDTWTAVPGDRETSYIRNSRALGMIPFFVFYNIPDSAEGYQLDVNHVQDPVYMTAYFKNLKLALDILKRESPDDPVGLILEPDFLGYLAQNAGAPASAIAAATHAAYDSGVLTAGPDPQFPDNVAGLVGAINYTISHFAPQAVFGWQVNLWASPAGGWTTPVPAQGLMHKTDSGEFAAGRAAIASEATAIASYYLAAGVKTYGASFISIDKYGLDAAGVEALAAADPEKSTWFWNDDLWGNYLTFAGAIHQAAGLPIVLWQLPVGHINSSHESNPYPGASGFPDLDDTYQHYEDSAGAFFFGDTFTTGGVRLAYFSQNQGGDAGLAVSGSDVTWSQHMSSAAKAGVMTVLFGAGVAASTTNVGDPPSDDFWWITKAQDYLASPVARQP